MIIVTFIIDYPHTQAFKAEGTPGTHCLCMCLISNWHNPEHLSARQHNLVTGVKYQMVYVCTYVRNTSGMQ